MPSAPPATGGVARALRALRVPEDLRRLERLWRWTFLRDRVVVPTGRLEAPSPLLGRLLAADDRRLDVGLGATLIACEDDPHTDVERVLDEVSGLALALRQRLRPLGTDPQARLEAFNRFFFEEQGFAAVPSIRGRYGHEQLADLLLPHVLRRRRGHCVGLSSIYLALGYAAGLPLFGVSAPGHFFVRWEGDGLRQNVELTARGVAHSDDYYVDRFRISQDAINRGVHLQSLRRREVLVEILNNRANVYWGRGDVARARRDLDRVVEVSHNFARAHAGRGFIAFQRGRLGVARDHLEKALEINPAYARAHLLLGQVFLRGGWLSRAQAAFERATDLDSGSALAATYLGRCLAARGEFDRAMQWHERSVRTDPQCETGWNDLGRTRLALGLRDEARAAFKEALRIRPKSLTARSNLVLLEKHGGELTLRGQLSFGGVCRDYERAMALFPQNHMLHTRYVHFLLGAGQRLERALPMALELTRRERSPDSLSTLAKVQSALGRREEARAALDEAIELDAARGGAARARLVSQQRELGE